MKKADIIRISVKYGALKRLIRKVSTYQNRAVKKRILADMKHAGEELLDYLSVCGFKSLKDFEEKVNNWLSLEAKMTGFEPTKYTIGQGENIFKKIVLERAIFYNRNKE